MNKIEALQKIKELQEFIEESDKPKRVMVYIKLNAKAVMGSNWNNAMNSMVGKVFEAKGRSGSVNVQVAVWETEERIESHFFNETSLVVVEGYLADIT